MVFDLVLVKNAIANLPPGSKLIHLMFGLSFQTMIQFFLSLSLQLFFDH